MSKKTFIQAPLLINGHNLARFLQVYNQRTGRPLGYIGNISQHGLMLISRWRIETGALFNLRVSFPGAGESVSHIDFDAKCQWCRPDVDASSFDSGYTIADCSANYHLLFEALRNYFCFRTTPQPFMFESGPNRPSRPE